MPPPPPVDEVDTELDGDAESEVGAGVVVAGTLDEELALIEVGPRRDVTGERTGPKSPPLLDDVLVLLVQVLVAVVVVVVVELLMAESVVGAGVGVGVGVLDDGIGTGLFPPRPPVRPLSTPVRPESDCLLCSLLDRARRA